MESLPAPPVILARSVMSLAMLTVSFPWWGFDIDRSDRLRIREFPGCLIDLHAQEARGVLLDDGNRDGVVGVGGAHVKHKSEISANATGSNSIPESNLRRSRVSANDPLPTAISFANVRSRPRSRRRFPSLSCFMTTRRLTYAQRSQRLGIASQVRLRVVGRGYFDRLRLVLAFIEVMSRGLWLLEPRGRRMNGVFPGVMAGLDFGPEVLGLLSLLGAAMLLLWAWAAADCESAACELVPAPVRLPIARRVEVRVHAVELARFCGTTRAPPGLSLPIRASQFLRACALN
jgi:hypothetical protein